MLGLIVLLVLLDAERTGQRLGLYLGFRALWLFSKLLHGVRPRGPDPLPASGPAILISNHTSPADPFFLQSVTPRVIAFLMAREYFDIRLLRPIFRLGNTILVNRTGHDTAATKAALRTLQNGELIGIFPEGSIHLDRKTFGRAKPGAALLALVTRVPVIPAFIDRPMRTNRLIEGIAVPCPTKVVFGRPIDLGRYYDRDHDAATLNEVTELMMNAIAALRPTGNPRS